MGSYICFIDNLKEIINKMKELAENTLATFNFNPEIIQKLTDKEFARVKWYYYCDDSNGNTIRLYDSKFHKNFHKLYVEPQDYVIFRGKDLGSEEDTLKTNIRNLLKQLQKPPQGINTNSQNDCLLYFEAKERNNSQEASLKIEMTKVDTMSIKLLHSKKQIILYGPPGTGKTYNTKRIAVSLLDGYDLSNDFLPEIEPDIEFVASNVEANNNLSSIDKRTLELVRDNPHKYTEEEIFQIICKEFSNHLENEKKRGKENPVAVLRDTTRRRLHGHLQKKYGVHIEKDEEGKFFIP